MDKIPSVISYTPSDGTAQQWAFDMSIDAVTMIRTKLELDVHEKVLDELQLLVEALDGMQNLDFDHVKRNINPGYTPKEPEEIVTDYLTKLFEFIDQDTDFIGSLKAFIPVDIVITTPVVRLANMVS